ncbi:anoctamin-4-like isoform X2 [Haliotis rufescens]|uniref:anoctamin-4-like isoform X2 n=1 Tax=Haliotis rufescens TaxID=6454 RepID=UPI00201ECF66|nr:anoctamin-4-like isoform X2 [Haliotis rufescens]
MDDKDYLVSPNGDVPSSPEKTVDAVPPQGAAVDLKTASLVAHTQAKLRHKAKKKHKKHGKDRPKLKRRMSQFERRYTELALDNKLIPERKRIDYVLVHPSITSADVKDVSKQNVLKTQEQNRRMFEMLLEKEGFSIQRVTIGGVVYVKLHCPFKRLCAEAERVKLQMPLKDCGIDAKVNQNRLSAWIERHFETDDEVDYVSATFLMDSIHVFENHEDPTVFFRPSLRSLLCHHMLINLDIRTVKEREEGWPADAAEERSCLDQTLTMCFGKRDTETERKNTKVLKKKGLPYLLMKKCYTDAYILHEDSVRRAKKEEIDGLFYPETKEEEDKMKIEMPISLITDPRKEMDDTWTKLFKFQPLWKIRNYFGEKIAFYFAWSGMLITTLWIPTLFGLGIFVYGLVLSISKNESSETQSNATLVEELKTKVTDVLNIIKQAFDNDVTPFFALLICLWGTVFLELWKRKVARLAYEWDVDDFEASEPDRPQFFGTKVKPDPVTNEETWFYPLKRQLLKFTTSASVLIFMISVVLISVTGVIIYRVIMDVDLCPGLTGTECLLLTTVVSSILNAISILLLGKFYDKLAVWLTDWENHRTQTRYDDALIIKLFAFQFVNSFASCFYIAFFRGRFFILNRGADYKDSCEGTCMSQLSFQVLVLMLVKPFPKFFKDIILPFLKMLWRKRPCCRKTKVDEVSADNKSAGSEAMKHQSFLERERLKPTLGDFTLGEYTEKVIQYGFLMLFAASFPLAPLLALITNLIDIRVDAKRMLWFNRRPVAFIAQDIGMWYDILTFVNFCGVLTNAFLIAFTSSWGSNFDLVGKLWIVIGFEHIVFVLKYILAYMIPDVPTEVRLAIRREKYQITKKLEDGKNMKMDFTHLYPESRSRLTSENGDEDVDDNMRGMINESSIVEEPASKAGPSTLRKRPSANNLWYTSEKSAGSELDKSQGIVSMSAINPNGSRLLRSQTSRESEEETTLSTMKLSDTIDDIDEEGEPVTPRETKPSPPSVVLPAYSSQSHSVWTMDYQKRGSMGEYSV